MPYGDGAVPVIDLRKRFELDAPIGEETRLMVLELETQRVAVLVDEVREVHAGRQHHHCRARAGGERPCRGLHRRHHHPRRNGPSSFSMLGSCSLPPSGWRWKSWGRRR